MKIKLESVMMAIMALAGAYALGFAVLCSTTVEQFVVATFLGVIGICGTLVLLTTKS